MSFDDVDQLLALLKGRSVTTGCGSAVTCSARLPHPATAPDRAFDWVEPGELIVRRIGAADSTPGVRATIAGRDLLVYDARLPACRRLAWTADR
ncbi:hypothetical protein ABZS66_00025 [Dactylosporangium sp. NPDC005572]|uniref:hypothetical protein n=1 Tax=Dactylosporangium sp. NPDC005572 TaxID=3156889 RepID=UPI0033B47876